ncbi:butyrate kinase [Staphylococcus sp. 17KM0847]|uniref:butyrate kinase n=1 Tax=Staphylococcus sp. 17KM0847 TaxID=2583989 RepID=UPI0015DD509D|nr:butyrate kinase [Staphylococcus sp. 17KM0847]QLK86100.1 butyrate kinase [Staphylococcus sp. 17KM0847]
MTNILILNLGSTSSKIAVYHDLTCVFQTNLVHDQTVTAQSLLEQQMIRQQLIEQTLEHHGYMTCIDVIACRGGLLKPLIGGTYIVNETMYQDLKSFEYGVHAANLSGMIGYQLGQQWQVPVFTTDPVVVDELLDTVRFTGIPGIERKSIFHALNHKAVARRYADEVNIPYEEINVIVAHLGGGISIAAHHYGRVIDVNEALYGEGPMALNRSGTIPNDLLLVYAQEHQLSMDDIRHILSSESGLKAYTGTMDFKTIMSKYDFDHKTTQLIDALVIQIAKTIAERAAVLQGQVDQIVLTGGMSYSQRFVSLLHHYTDWIAPTTVYPGEHEMMTLAERAFKAFHKKININTYC